MNIFVLDSDPAVAATYHTDKHVRKMIVESAQMLSTAHQIINGPNPNVYKIAYKNHPCTKWARESKSNYNWLFELFVNLLTEYYFRFNKHHKCSELVKHLKYVPNILKEELTPFALAMPDQYKTNDAVKSYRSYYIHEKNHLFYWTGNIPKFVTNTL
jgi:hypothetical protein